MPKHTPSFSTHLEEYVFASNYVYKKDVLDLGASWGYGSHILSYGANKIDLVDIDSTTIEEAKVRFKYFCPVNFIQADLEKEFIPGNWDVIVGLQVLEHLSNPEQTVQQSLESLREGGIFIFGIPHMLPAENHKHLYKKEDVLKLFENFSDVKIFVQDKKVISGDPHYKGRKSYVGIAYK